MKKLEDPIEGTLFYVRNRPWIYGTITRVYYGDWYSSGNVKIINITWLSDEKLDLFHDLAYPSQPDTENFYVYLDMKDTPKNRLAFKLKHL